MTTIRITTDRLPQPERRKGAVLTVTPEKAASMVAQGFAEIVEDLAPQRAPEPPAQPLEAPKASTPMDAAQAAPAPAPEAAATPAPRRRRGDTL